MSTTTRRQLSALAPDLQQRLQVAVAAIVQIASPEQVILFGSRATGEAREDSDVDLLVVAATPSWPKLARSLRRALRPLLQPLTFDLLVYPPEVWEKDRRVPGFAAREADLRGIRLYERG